MTCRQPAEMTHPEKVQVQEGPCTGCEAKKAVVRPPEALEQNSQALGRSRELCLACRPAEVLNHADSSVAG